MAQKGLRTPALEFRLTDLPCWSLWYSPRKAEQKTLFLVAAVLQCGMAVAADQQNILFLGIASLLYDITAVMETP
jgi:hypothetical protein